MLSTAIVIFREMLEISMILGVVLAATQGLAGRLWWIFGGFAAGIAGASLVALFAESISLAMAGMGQELFNALILFVAALFIGWTIVWMRRHARTMSVHLRQVGHEVAIGKLPFYSLSAIIALALLREGSEVVLFIYGMALSGQTTTSIVTGSIIGVLLGTIAGVMLYYGLLKLSARYMLRVTSWMLILLVAGLTSQGAGYLTAAGYFSGFSSPLWDSSWLLSDGSIVGKALHSLIGYTARPTGIECSFYAATLALLCSITFLMDRNTHRHAAAHTA